MATVQALLRSASRLSGESARRDVEILLCHVLGKPRTWLYTWPEAEIEGDLANRFKDLLSRRLAGEPVAYLTGERDFWTLSLRVNAHTLIPRPETEVLVEWALGLTLSSTAAVADMGTGSGAIALALASERPGWRVHAVDRSAEALAVAEANAAKADLACVRWQESDWFESLSNQQFDLIVSNPPYIDANDDHLQRGDLRYEPRNALVADENGLAALRTLAQNAPRFLTPGGVLLLEHGYTQANTVREMLVEAGFHNIETRRDLAGCERVTGGALRAD